MNRVSPKRREEGILVLQNGEVFSCELAGAVPKGGISSGELVFNTAMSGYQEVLTDPSYAGQVIAFTYPHIGNYGTNSTDTESLVPHCTGVIMRTIAEVPSSWRSKQCLEDWLITKGLSAAVGVDTRRLTRTVREFGSIPCAFGAGTKDEITQGAINALSTNERDLVSLVTTEERKVRGEGPFHLVVYDFGIKETMLAKLGSLARLSIVPAKTSAKTALSLMPDGIFLSNGPGDPAALREITTEIAALIGTRPIFGICLGHQILSLALGGSTYKLPFGHHGSNHPVQEVASGKVEITSQNHNYAVATVPGAEITHVNLNDGVIEGMALRKTKVISVQYHPEAGPGPHDAHYLFNEFFALLESPKTSKIEESSHAETN